MRLPTLCTAAVSSLLLPLVLHHDLGTIYILLIWLGVGSLSNHVGMTKSAEESYWICSFFVLRRDSGYFGLALRSLAMIDDEFHVAKIKRQW